MTKKNLKNYISIVAIFLLTIISAFVLIWAYRWRSTPQLVNQELINRPASMPAVKKVDMAKLEQDYNASVVAILQKYDTLMAEPSVLAADSGALGRPDPESMKPLLDELLSLRVPPEHKEFHLALTIAWTKLAEEGVEQSLRQDYVNNVISLRETNSWLK